MIYQILKSRHADSPETAVTTAELMEITGLTQRQIVAQVEKERGRHFINSCMKGKGGYYRPRTRADVAKYNKIREYRIAQTAITMKMSRKFLKRWGN
ncbi:hypothetical cytosolic protein [Acidaminococcus sp. CAG:542]|nr:hypothetical cytosolic protein [Acidaminococcus sp. CAG:542]